MELKKIYNKKGSKTKEIKIIGTKFEIYIISNQKTIDKIKEKNPIKKKINDNTK